MDRQSTAKTAKIGSLENFRPYGIAEGEQRVLEYGTLVDVGARTAASVTKVSWNNMLNSDTDYISA